MNLTALFKRHLPRFRAPKPSPTCWVCDTPVGRRYPEDSYGSPLGDAFTFSGCEDCALKRAVTPEHAAWFLNLAGADDTTGAAAWMIKSIDAGGETWDRPIHVYLEGRYEPLMEWAASTDGKAFLGSFRERRGVQPGEDARRKFGIGILHPERTDATAH